MVRKASSCGSVALIALTVLTLVGLAGCLGSKATQDKTLKETEVLNGSKNGTLLRLKPLEDPLKFHLVSQERTLMNKVPQYKTNMDMSFDFSIKRISGTDYEIEPSKVDGIDLDKKQTNHLKKIAAIIDKAVYRISAGEMGTASDPAPVKADNSRWSGAMALRAIGLFEHGFLDTMLPDENVEPGSRWRRSIDYSEEATSSDSLDTELNPATKKSSKFDQTGTEAEYKLVKIESINGVQIAEIAYNSSGVVDIDLKNPMMGDSKYQQRITEKGTIKLDAKTGWPIEVKIVKTIDTNHATVPSIEEYTTHVKRI